jgi:hypothetical protein
MNKVLQSGLQASNPTSSIVEDDDWIPYKLVWQGQWLCRWLALAGQQFTEPFFSETILKCKTCAPNGSRYASLTSLEMLVQAAATPLDAIPPSAFIFHVSRCGSTLLAQLLGLSQRHIVLSEVPLIDEILRLSLKDPGVAPTDIAASLRAIISLLARKQTGDSAHLFIKLDSWHVIFAPLIRKLYPDVPFVMLYRSPDEVVHSHQKRRGMQAVPGLLEPELFELSPDDVSTGDADDYLDKVLGFYFSSFMKTAAQDKRVLLLNYQVGSMEIIRRVAAHADIAISKVDLELMEVRSRFHSKYPNQTFSETQANPVLSGRLGRARAMYLQLENR